VFFRIHFASETIEYRNAIAHDVTIDVEVITEAEAKSHAASLLPNRWRFSSVANPTISFASIVLAIPTSPVSPRKNYLEVIDEVACRRAPPESGIFIT